MLDLNLEVVISSGSSSRCQAETAGPGGLKLPEAKGDDSGTSNSSVVNAAEDNGDDSSPLPAFDFMTKREEAPGGEIITRQFFPVVAGGVEGGEVRRRFGKGTTEWPQWLYVSFGESRGESGMVRQQQQMQPPPHHPVRKSRRGPRSRSSQYRGVTFYRRTGRWESHIWDCGKQVYLGGFDTAYAAARAYDQAAIKFRGVDADINFSIRDYEEDMKQMSNLTKEEFVRILRRQSTGFSREASKYRGATLQKCGIWDHRMGQSLGKRPYDKAMRKPEPGLYEGRIIFNACGKGSGGQNLDLSLGMSPTTIPISSKVIENKKEYVELIDREETGLAVCQEFPMAGCSSSVPKGGGIANFALPPKRPPIWSSMYPAVLPNYELTVEEKRVEAISSSSLTRLPCYRWPLHGNNPVNGSDSAQYAMPMFASNNLNNAASSGFSSSTTTPPPPYLTTVSASAILPKKDGFHVPAAGGYFAYRE